MTTPLAFYFYMRSIGLKPHDAAYTTFYNFSEERAKIFQAKRTAEFLRKWNREHPS